MPQSKNIIEVAVQTVSLHFCYNKLFPILCIIFAIKPPPPNPSHSWTKTGNNFSQVLHVHLQIIPSSVVFIHYGCLRFHRHSLFCINFNTVHTTTKSKKIQSLPDLLFQRKLPVLFEAPIRTASMHKFLQHQFPEKGFTHSRESENKVQQQKISKHCTSVLY